jgi:hypothetical protein
MASFEPIEVLSHFEGTPDVSAFPDVEIETRQVAGCPPGTTLEPPEPLAPPKPELLQKLKPGELAVADDEGSPDSPLVLVSVGRKADLTDKEDLINTAREAGRAVQIHVFDDPNEVS